MIAAAVTATGRSDEGGVGLVMGVGALLLPCFMGVMVLTDSRLAQVFDVEDGNRPYVVLEWAAGECPWWTRTSVF